MKTDTITAESLAEVQRMLADCRTAHPRARIVQEDAPVAHDTDAIGGGWTIRLTYEEWA
jgi:hypothetical protein